MTADPEKLKREAAGRYVSADGRFTVEQAARAFWGRLGYVVAPTHQFGREL